MCGHRDIEMLFPLALAAKIAAPTEGIKIAFHLLLVPFSWAECCVFGIPP
jgi:hypothetical protein